MPKDTARKRQFGTEKRTQPLSMIHDRPSIQKTSFSRIAIILTISLWVLYVISVILRQFLDGPLGFRFTMEAFGYLVVVTFLTLSSLMYLILRQGAFERFKKHIRVPRSKIDEYFSTHHPTITVLVPSYSEEVDVIRKTLMSAALQEYPNMRIVLLIDDPPNPSDADAEEKLNSTRLLPQQIMELLSVPREFISSEIKKFNKKYSTNKAFVELTDIKELADNYYWVIDWLNTKAVSEKRYDHVDTFYTDNILKGLSDELKYVADALTGSYNERIKLKTESIRQLYNRLVWIFNAKLETFERKKYASLSHEANKAMNLNSYIGLMGGSYIRKQTPLGIVLSTQNGKNKGDVNIPDTDFILTLDADSMLLREYCLRLIYFLEEEGNSKVAIAQTPYSSYRGAETRIERLASATTDIQHILHQGLSHYGATFWVGANAVIRKKALDDIVEIDYIGGFEIKRYIQDRTVIEDTESSIDLTMHGWKIINYPERLSYSATPPDFGSLVVQRRRWANGGLLILPKFFSQIKKRKRNGDFVPQMEILLRINYMASIAWSTLGLIFLLAFPYDSTLLSPIIILAALPYFIAMSNDLKYCGYKRMDVFRIYGFNLILLPVNLAGTLKSLQQAITGSKIPFARTPKVKNRTIASMLYVIAPILIVGFSVFTLVRDETAHNWGNTAFAAFNAIVALYAIIAYIGIFNAIADIWHGIINWIYIDVKEKKNIINDSIEKQDFDWRSALYFGGTGNGEPSYIYNEED